MTRLLPIVVLGMLAGGCAGARASAPEPATKEAPAMTATDLYGTWVYAEDPKGEIPTDPVYANSTMRFGADGSYAFGMGTVTLEGRWERTGGEGDTLKLHTSYAQKAQTEVTITFRRNDAGEVEGLVLREGDGANGLRYYVQKD